MIAAAPIAVTAAVCASLVLGLLGIGTSAFALLPAACATWAAAALLVPSGAAAPRPTALTVRRGLAVGAAGGTFAGLVLWFLKYPAVGGDGLLYHLPEVVRWVQTGQPGSIVSISSEVPFGNYPLTNEVALAWGAGIAGSFVPVTLWTPAVYLLLLGAAWCGLREFGTSAATAALGVAALGSSPLLLSQMNGPNTDLPALAWLVTSAALCAASRRLPAMLAPAVLAAALAVGTKTTTLPLAAVCLVLALVGARAHLGALKRPLALAASAAGVAGGVWYARNLVTHGSPLWPFVKTPGGDPLPPLLDRLGERLLFEPDSTKGRLDDYARVLGGDLVLLAGALLAPLLRPRREVLVAAAVTAFAFLAWASAPFTAYPQGPFYDPLATGATRYLFPAFAAATLALALAARAEGAGGLVARGLLGGALALNLLRAVTLGFPFLPSLSVLVAGALLGAAALTPAVVRRLVVRPSPAVGVATVVAVGALLAPSASGYVERQARIPLYSTGAVAWLASQPDFRAGAGPVVFRGRPHGTLAGDRLQHRLVSLDVFESCAALRAAARGGWILVTDEPPPLVPGFDDLQRRYQRDTARVEACLARSHPAYADGATDVYRIPAAPKR